MTACAPQKLSVFTTYVTRENLASYYVGTPDPKLNHPDVGQKLFVTWRLPPQYLEKQPLMLRLYLRYHNRTYKTFEVEITQLSGCYIYSLLNTEFFDTEGLLSYKIQILNNDVVLDEWRHKIWADPIIFNSNDDSDSSEDDVKPDDKANNKYEPLLNVEEQKQN